MHIIMENKIAKGVEMEIRTLENFKKQFKNTDRDKIIEMFYNMGLKQIDIEKKLKQDIEKWQKANSPSAYEYAKEILNLINNNEEY